MANNLLVDWLNNKKKNVQTNVLRKSATNTNNVTTPNLPIKPTTVSQTGLNLQKVQQPVQTRLNNINTQTAPTQTNTWVGSIAQTPNQSRFIGFQQQQPQAKSFNKLMNNEYLMIPTAVNQANFANAKEENRYRTAEQVIKDFAWDVKNSNWNLTREDISKYYKEWEWNEDAALQLQVDILPLVQQGQFPDMNWVSQTYWELLKGKELKDIQKIKESVDINNKKLQQIQTNIDKTLKTNWQSLSPNWMKYIQNWNTVLKTLDEAKKQWVVWWASNVEIIDYLAKNNSEFNNIFKELNGLELSEMDKAIVWKKDASLLKQVQNKMSQILIDQVTNSERPTDEEIESVMRGKEKLENDFWGQTGKKIATEIGVPVDSLEKLTYRTYKDIQNKILETGMEYTKDYAKKELKSAFKEWLWVDLTDEQLNSIDNLYNKAAAPSINEQIKINKQNVIDYAESVNKEYESRKARNLDPDVENYVNNMGMTRSLLQWNLAAFGYKSAGDMAQNADMLVTTALWVVAPEVVLPLMAVDSYSRESQESFEELMETQKKMWISQDEAYDNAQKWSVIVWLASATVELALEKLIWWVETTASKAWHDAFTKEFTKKATEMMTERWLADILKQWATTQFKASLEEWLEEVLQQTIHNKAVQQYDPDQKLTEWLLQAFEWGFYNPMNLLAWGGDVFSNIDTNSIKQWVNNTVDNATAKARDIVGNVQQSVNNWVNNVRDFMDRKNKVTSQNAWGNTETQLQGEQTNISSENANKWNNTSINVQNNNIKSTNGAIELEEDTTESKKTAIKEWWLGEKVLESLNWLDENTRERIKKNPYSVEESKNLIKEMDENPWIDFRDYQNGRYEEVLDTVLKKLEQKENKRSKDIWTLYDKLEEANAPVDVTELKNKVAEFQAQAEALEDIATPAEQAQIKTILENIEKIWDWTMDVWKVRKIADKRSKRSASSSYDGIGLIWDIRDAIDDVIVKWNPDMKEVDKSYSKVLKEIWEIKWKLFYKNWWLKSNAVSTIKNMMNAGNRIDLNNLEKYIPWIKKQLQAIDDSKFVYNAYTTWKGSRFISGIARWVFGNIWKAIWFFTGWWGWLVAWAVVDAGVDTALVKLTRKALRDTITKETAASRAELERISKKIEEWEKLDAEDKARLKELGEKIKRNGEQMAKTKAEKEAWIKMMDENITPQTTEEEQEKNKVTKKKTTKKNKVTEKNNEAENKVTKKEPVKKAEATEYINETLQNERGQMEEIEAEENLRNNETPQRDMVEEAPKNKVTSKKAETATEQENRQARKPREDQTRTELLYWDLEELWEKVEDADWNLTPIADVADKFTDYVHRVWMEKSKWEYDARNIAKAIKEYFDNHKIDDFYKKEVLRDDGVYRVEISDEALTDILNRTIELETGTKWDKKVRQITWKVTQGIIEEERKNKITGNKKNKVTNPSKVKESGLFNENEVEKGKESEWLNPDALPLSDYREMQRLNDGYSLTSLSSALSKESLKDYMANKIANEKIWVKPDFDDNEAWDKLPEDFEDDWGAVASDIEEMYDAYEEYLDMKNGGDTFDENTLKNTLESANDYANRQFPWKTAKEVIDQYTPEYESDLKIYNRLIKKYPSVFANWKIDLTGAEGKARRELASQENETAQDIDYQELAERENETPQVEDEELNTSPLDLEFESERRTAEELDENETPQADEEEMNKVTKKQAEKTKNLVTSRIEESTNTDSKAEQIFNTSMEQLKGAKKVSLWALGKVKQTEVKLDNWTTITYIDSSVGKGISQNAIIRVNSPEAWYKTYVVTKIPNNPAEIREWGNVLTDEQVDKVYDILQWKTGEVKVEDMKVDVENVENKKDPINAFLDNNEAIKNDPKLKYKYLSRLNDQTSWIDYSTDIRYNWTVAEKVQQTIDSFGKLSNWTRLPIKFSKNNYGNYIEVGDWETGLASRNIWDDIEFEYAKFLYDNPEIRSTKEIKADWLKEAIKKWNEIHKEVVKDAEEQKAGTPLDPEKYIRQQPTADEWIEAVYNETKKVSDYFEAHKEFENSWRIGYTEEYRNKIKAAQDALWRKLKFKSDRSKLYQDFVKNIRESNWNEKQLRSIAKNLYIQKVKDDFKNNYNYPTEVTDKVPWLRTAKDNYDRYLKGRDTSFSGKDPRIDYSDKDRIWAWIKRQDWNQITAEQRREIVNGVLEYAKYMGIDMKKMSEDAGVTYVHLNWKHPFLTSKAVWLFHWTFKSISVWADMESYREKMGQSKDAKTETHTVPVVMAHEITHAIDSMFEWNLFSDVKTREMGRKMNEGRSLWAYWHSKEEITARMVEEYVDVMKGWKWYYNMRWYWNKDVFDNEIKPYVEQIFDEKFNWYKLTAKERNDIKLDEAQINKNSVTASALNRVTSK